MREMKDSGIEWVGQIPSGWSFERGKYHFTNNKYIPGIHADKYDRLSLTMQGVLPRSKDDVDGLQPKDFDTYQLLSAGELVFKLIDLQNVSTSRVGLAHDTGLVSPAYIILHAKPDVSTEYMKYFYLMMWHREIFNALGDNGVRSNLGAYDLLEVGIPVPSLPEQRRIADFLDAKCAEIDALTADIEKQIETLEQYKRSVITEAVTKGLNPDVEMKESKLEWVDGIPQNWEEKPYRVLFSEVTTKNKFGQEKNALKFTYGNIVPKTDFDADTDDYVADTVLTYTIVEPGTIMINCLNLNYDFVSQRIGLVKDKGIITSAYLAIKPNSQMVCDRFANYQLKAFDGMKVFHNMGTGIRKTLGFDELGKKYFILPPLDEQVKIANYLDAKSEEIQAIVNNKKKELSSLAEYKKSLIYEYVTGKKEVC